MMKVDGIGHFYKLFTPSRLLEIEVTEEEFEEHLKLWPHAKRDNYCGVSHWTCMWMGKVKLVGEVRVNKFYICGD